MKSKDKDNGPLQTIAKEVVAKHSRKTVISPAWIATECMVKIGFKQRDNPLGYLGCHLQFRQIARGICGRNYENPPEEAGQGDLHPETLQSRYPRKRNTDAKDTEPEYILRDHMSDEDIEYNVARLRSEGAAKLRHADTLEAWGRSRKRAKRA